MQNNPYFQPQVELLNEAAQSTMDYSAKVAARQVALARKVAEGDFSWQNLFTAPVNGQFDESVKEYTSFAQEAVQDFVQASGRNCDMWERAATEAVERTQALLPVKSTDYSRQVIDNIKATSTAVKDGVRTAADGFNQAAPVAAKAAANGNGAARKNGKK